MESRPMNKVTKTRVRKRQIPKILQPHLRFRIHKQHAGIVTSQLQPATLPVHLKSTGQEIIRNQKNRQRSLHDVRDLLRRTVLEEVDGFDGESHRQIDVGQEDRLLRRWIGRREEFQRLVFE